MGKVAKPRPGYWYGVFLIVGAAFLVIGFLAGFFFGIATSLDTLAEQIVGTIASLPLIGSIAGYGAHIMLSDVYRTISLFELGSVLLILMGIVGALGLGYLFSKEK